MVLYAPVSRGLLRSLAIAASLAILPLASHAETFTWTGAAADQYTANYSSFSGLITTIPTTNSPWSAGAVFKSNWRLDDNSLPIRIPGPGDVVVFGDGFGSGVPVSNVEQRIGELRITSDLASIIDFEDSTGDLRALGLETGRLIKTSSATTIFNGNLASLTHADFELNGALSIKGQLTVLGSMTLRGGGRLQSPFDDDELDGFITQDLFIQDGYQEMEDLLVGRDLIIGDNIGADGSASYSWYARSVNENAVRNLTINREGEFFLRKTWSTNQVTVNGGDLVVFSTNEDAVLRTPLLIAAPGTDGSESRIRGTGVNRPSTIDFTIAPSFGTIQLNATTDSAEVAELTTKIKASELRINGRGVLTLGLPTYTNSYQQNLNEIGSTVIESGTVVLARGYDSSPLGPSITIGKAGETIPARVRVDVANQLANTTDVTILQNGRFTVYDSSIDTLSFNGGGLVDAGTTNGGLTLGGSQTVAGGGNASIQTHSLTLGAPTHDFNVGAGTTLLLATNVSGNAVTKSGGGTLRLAGTASNTISELSVRAGTLALTNIDGTNAVGTQLSVGTVGQSSNLPMVHWEAPNQVPDNQLVVLNAGFLDLDGQNETLLGVTVAGGATAGLSTGPGTVTFTGASTVFEGSPLQITGNLDLSGGERPFYAFGSTSGASNFTNISITGTINNGTFVKQGPGIARFNSITGNAVLKLNDGSASVGTAIFGGLAGVRPLSIDTSLTVNMPNATASTFSGSLSGTGKLIKSGAGTIELFTVTNTLAGGVDLSAGTILLRSPSALGSAAPRFKSFTNVVLDLPNQTAARFTHAATTLEQFATIRLGNDGLIVDYAGASPFSVYNASIAQARNNGAWNDFGITSLLATNDPNRVSVGIAEASSIFTGVGPFTWRGQSVDPTSLLIAATILGDTNLDGTVNFDDLLKLAQNYGGTGKTWVQGDSNYDGTVNFDDLLKLAQVYGSSLLADAAMIAGADAHFASDLALVQSLVPEPATACVLGGAVVLTRRSRRSRRSTDRDSR